MEFIQMMNYVFDPANAFQVVFSLVIIKFLFFNSFWRYPLLSIIIGLIPAYLQGYLALYLVEFIDTNVYWVIPVAYAFSDVYFVFYGVRTDPIESFKEVWGEFKTPKKPSKPEESKQKELAEEDLPEILQNALKCFNADENLKRVTFEHEADGEKLKITMDYDDSEDSEDSYEAPPATRENSCEQSTDDN